MKMELTWNRIKKLIDCNDIYMSASYDEDRQLVRFTSRDKYRIADLNDWLLDNFSHYLDNISYSVNEMYIDKYNPENGSYWLELICIRREVA